MEHTNDEPNIAVSQEPSAAPGGKPSTRSTRRPRRRGKRTAFGKLYFGTDVAAEKLDTSNRALLQRVRRCVRWENGQAVARLGMGVVARKLGKTWRFFFEDDGSADAT
jgi:hypothetical protein